MKKVVNLVLLCLVIALVYANFSSVNSPLDFDKQRLEYNAVAKIVEKGYKNKTIPDEVIDVFKATGKKFKLMKNRLKII